MEELKKYEKEHKQTSKQQHVWVKNHLAYYVSLFKPVSNLLESNVDSWVYGGPGHLRACIFAEIWDLYNEHLSVYSKDLQVGFDAQRTLAQLGFEAVNQWVNKPVNAINSAYYKRFRADMTQKLVSIQLVYW